MMLSIRVKSSLLAKSIVIFPRRLPMVTPTRVERSSLRILSTSSSATEFFTDLFYAIFFPGKIPKTKIRMD